MKIEKVNIQSTEWVIFIGKTPIPLAAIKSMFLPILIIVIAALAYNVGQMDTILTLNYLNNITTPKCDYSGCTHCTVTAVGNKIIPNCTSTNLTK